MSGVGVLVKLLHFVVEVIVGSSPVEVGGGRVRLGLGWLPAAHNRPVLHTKSSLVGVCGVSQESSTRLLNGQTRDHMTGFRYVNLGTSERYQQFPIWVILEVSVNLGSYTWICTVHRCTRIVWSPIIFSSGILTVYDRRNDCQRIRETCQMHLTLCHYGMY